jgi:uncharacterized membrane protein
MMFNLWRINRSALGRAKNLPWLVVAIICLAAALRFVGLGHESLWLDEAYQVVASNNNVASILQTTIHFDTHPPLYYLLLHYWMLGFGHSEAAVRSLSACLGIISVALVYDVGKELFNRRTGLVASFLLAISTFALWTSQDDRPYSLLMALSALSFLFFVRILRADKPSKTLVLFYSLANILLLYTHIYGVFIVATEVLFMLLFRRNYAKAQTAFWFSLVATLIAFSPWIFVFMTSVLGSGVHGLDWIPRPTVPIVDQALDAISGGIGFIVALIVSVVGVLGFTVSQRRVSQGKSVQMTTKVVVKSLVREPRTALLLIWFLFTLVASLVLSFAIRPIFWDRYLSGIAPALCLLVARGVDNGSLVISAYFKRVKVPMAAMVIVGVITLLALPSLYNYYAVPHKEQWREVVQLIEGNAKPGDAIVIYTDGYRIPFDYYYKGDPAVIVPSYVVVQNGDSVASMQRIWLVLMNYASTYNAPIKEDLFTRYGNDSLALEKHFAFINVYLFNTQLKSSAPHSQ